MGISPPSHARLDAALFPAWDSRAHQRAAVSTGIAATAAFIQPIAAKPVPDGRNQQLSPWVRSAGKHVFDLICVLCVLPIVLPVAALVALAVRLTSHGPVLYRQQRMGRYGRPFTILKFRTMPVARVETDRLGLTTEGNQRFTPVGPFLRRWKLDELPQLLNILRGEMSLVGPRPKLPRYEAECLVCRPGLTGFATLVFAREEQTMARLPNADVEAYYQAVVKPFKHRLDAEYMGRATLFSDLGLVLRSVFRRWDDMALAALPPWIPGQHGTMHAEPWTVEQPAMLGPEEGLGKLPPSMRM